MTLGVTHPEENEDISPKDAQKFFFGIPEKKENIFYNKMS